MDLQSFIPFHLPSIGDEERQEMEATLRSGWLTTGPRTLQFERDFGAYVGARYSLALSSCTAGLHLAVAGLGIGRGDEVITTPMTFCSTVHAILQTGATPVLADIKPDGNIDPEQIERAITPRTRAIIPVHLAGLPCDMEQIWAIAAPQGIYVVEDAAHAAGAKLGNHYIGSSAAAEGFSDATAFSFYATKNMTTGEGGMVTTPSGTLDQRMRSMALHGMNRDAWKRYSAQGGWYYEVENAGFKYNFTDMQAALGIHQLRKLESFIAVRTRYAEIYSREFADVDEVEVPESRAGVRHAWHLYILRLNLKSLSIGRDAFIAELKRKGIGTSVHFIPIPIHPYFAAMGLGQSNCARALEMYPRIISLPLYPAMTEEQIHHVADCVKDVVAANKTERQVFLGAA
jgi:dTDP-4-amino-4,6-dideoxygalactose transaminase